MFRRHYTTSERKRIAVYAAILAVLCVIVWTVASGIQRARAEEATIRVWIMCQPGDWVNARKAPSTRSDSVARMETGDSFEIDGRAKNGFMFAPNLPCENGEAWIYAGYIVTEEPQNACGRTYKIETNGRVACRKYIEGPRRCWVVDGSTVKVYAYTSEWAVTSKGFVQSRYIGGLLDE